MPSTALKPSELMTLAALTAGPLHGYALTRRIEVESDGQVRLLPGNLYAVLQRLGDQGLVREAAERPEPARDDKRRRYFELTSAGRQQVLSEARRLQQLATSIQTRLGDLAIDDPAESSS